ncbi:DUF4192 family protein [Mobilicoccus pelagius]|uniref:DUF4192 family protein n=1 Tax=Mobilicoccus pelagius TaxID=746032 RepID=UPI0002FEB6A2|nr:DUF4192 family protein [Mobilicoccus pelagius]
MTVHSLSDFVETIPSLAGYQPDGLTLSLLGADTGRHISTSVIRWQDRADSPTLTRVLRQGVTSHKAAHVIAAIWRAAAEDDVDATLTHVRDLAKTCALDVTTLHVTDDAVRLIDQDGAILATTPRDPALASVAAAVDDIAENREALRARIEAGPHALAPAPMPSVEDDILLGVWNAHILADEPEPVQEADDLTVAALAEITRRVGLRDAILARLVPLNAEDDENALSVERICAAKSHMTELAHRLADVPAAANLLGMLATVAWHIGDGATQQIAAARALRIDPEHNLARLMALMGRAGVPGRAVLPS